mgnify:CR=1 FL=1
MTGYTVHTGATKKFTQGWDNIFEKNTSEGKPSGRKKADRTAAAGAAKSKSAGNSAGKKKTKSRK